MLHNMKQFIISYFFLVSGSLVVQVANAQHFEVVEVDNSFFKQDKYWRGADGAATIDLGNGKILWLFSDTFIDTEGTGKRSNAKMINNSIAIQDAYNFEKSKLQFYYKGTNKLPESFFDLPDETWFWTGHGVVVKGKLVIFLFEEEKSSEGLGFKSVGWSMVIIDNPNDEPTLWKMKYVKGPDTFGIIVGSSAVLKDNNHVFVYGVKEPGEHEVFLLRFGIDKLLSGDLSGMEWWVNNSWKRNVKDEPKSAVLFSGQTEFSVHYDNKLNKYFEIQTNGFGNSPVCYRLADKMQGPWSEPVVFYQPKLNHPKEFVYTANAHPEINADGLIITYNINNFDFETLLKNEAIYFPKILKLKFKDDK